MFDVVVAPTSKLATMFIYIGSSNFCNMAPAFSRQCFRNSANAQLVLHKVTVVCTTSVHATRLDCE